ncbi:hypothetical protein [Streptomyces marincola]|uniref:hypothetical protein n=1 Tax=Streptomyces marincola TaxID=2878388 RepID=UPI001CF1482E|nr:hypothetical protein [Streptomyces marincola]UCM91099.1 hypothetical protein LC193_25885 [Streptomyces marincola]
MVQTTCRCAIAGNTVPPPFLAVLVLAAPPLPGTAAGAPAAFPAPPRGAGGRPRPRCPRTRLG